MNTYYTRFTTSGHGRRRRTKQNRVVAVATDNITIQPKIMISLLVLILSWTGQRQLILAFCVHNHNRHQIPPKVSIRRKSIIFSPHIHHHRLTKRRIFQAIFVSTNTAATATTTSLNAKRKSASGNKKVKTNIRSNKETSNKTKNSKSITAVSSSKNKKGDKSMIAKQQPTITAGHQQQQSKSDKSYSTPPWQVLSQKDAKKNVNREKKRREMIHQQQKEEDISSSSATINKYEYDDDDDDVTEDNITTMSKRFLSNVEQSFLNWKRFNPSSTSSGIKFVASVMDKKLPPRIGVPEIAFLGRSNVGKSSLLNRLTSFSKKENGYNDVARVGKTPGATASVNLYAFYDRKEKPLLGFVDLPGFGYAKLSKDIKESVQLAAETYLGKRDELVLGVLLVDIRRIPSEDDRIVLAALFDMGVPIIVVATKIDKVSKTELEKQLENIRIGLGLPEGQPFCVSSVTGEGTKVLWNIILEAAETGVEEFRKNRLEIGTDHEEKEAAEKTVVLEDDEGESYSQGYDWVQESVMYESTDSDMIYYEEDDDNSFFLEEETMNANNAAPQKRESLKELKRKARKMEREKNV